MDQHFARKFLVNAALIFVVCTGKTEAGNAYLRPDDRILCAGDSITAPGTYQKYIEEILRVLYPGVNITLVNLGSGGKGADFGVNSLKLNKEPATLALFMFGVNDTDWRITNPDQKVAKFVGELRKAVAIAQAGQYPLIFLREFHFNHGANPPPDAFEVKITGMMDKLQEAQATLAAEQGIPMINVRDAYQHALEKAWAEDPACEFTPDIIHPSPAGQAAVACEILSAFGAGLPLSRKDGPRGEMQIQRAKDLVISLANDSGVIALDSTIPITVAVQNQAKKEVNGKLLVVLAGQKFEKNLRLKPGSTTNASFELPPVARAGRYDTTPVYIVFIGNERFVTEGGLFNFSRIHPSAQTPLCLSSSDFTTLQPEKTPRTCPVNDVRAQRSGENITVDFTWNDSTPVYAQQDCRDYAGNPVNAPLNLNARDGQSCDAVEFFLDLRPVQSIGRWTSNIDANPPGILRIGVYQELADGKPLAKILTQPATTTGAVTLSSQGEHRYRLSIHAKAAGPSLGFSMRVTDNTIFKTGSTQVFLLAGYPQYLGKDPMTFLQLGEKKEGLFYRFGY